VKAVLFANTDWHLYNFRLNLAIGLMTCSHDVSPKLLTL